MTIDKAINTYEITMKNLERLANSAEGRGWKMAYKKTYEDRKQIHDWLKELQAYRAADEEIRQLTQVREEGAGIAKCIVILNKHLKEVTMEGERR